MAGRKPLPPDKRKDDRCGLRVSEDERRFIAQLRRQRGWSETEVLRQGLVLLRQKLEGRPGRQDGASASGRSP